MFRDRTAIITGAGGGIGRGLAVALAQRGAHVWLADVDEPGLHATANAIERAGGRTAEYARVDVRSFDEVNDLVQRVASLRGGLDLMFNNAGVVTMGEFWAFDPDEWRRLIDVNLMGAAHGSLAAYRVMLPRRRGHIVNTASMTGVSPAPLITPYAATKHAIVGLTVSLRAEARAYGVRASVVCPGYVESDMLDMQGPHHRVLHEGGDPRIRERTGVRAMTPERVARAVLRGVQRNRAYIVPGAVWRARWRFARCAPWLVDRWAASMCDRTRRALTASGFDLRPPG
jgi:NAD(P)-dependent dehydrogenase (short-subunit alcohol dehydrogenase family)